MLLEAFIITYNNNKVLFSIISNELAPNVLIIKMVRGSYADDDREMV